MLLSAADVQGIKSADDLAASSSSSSEGSFYSPADIQAMDPKSVRRVLTSLGLPGAGTPGKLQQRALAVAEAVAAGDSLAEAVEKARRLR